MIPNHKSKEQKLLQAIRSAARAGRIEATRRAQWKYFNSFSAKICAANYGLKKTMGPDEFSALELRDIENFARQIEIWSEPDEPISSRLKEKPSGGYRLICEFGPLRRSIQYLIKQALNATTEAKTGQFDRGGRGKDDMIEAAAEWIEQGYQWVALVDIRDCYGSFDPSAVVSTLPLPEIVTRTHVLLRRREIRLSRRDHRVLHRQGTTWGSRYPSRQVLSSIGSAGIPQGSAASSIVASIALSDIFELFPQGTPVAQYGDDIAIFARTRMEARTILNALVGALNEHRCGPMELKRQEVRNCRNGFELLGYWLKLKNERCIVTPSAKNLKRIWRKLASELRIDFDNDKQRPTKAERALSNWTSGFSAATGNRYWQNELLSEVRYRYLLARGAADRRYLSRHGDLRRSAFL